MDEGFPDHFSERAGAYSSYRPTYPEELADFLAGSAPSRGLAWDAGCGSGQFSLLLAEQFRRVLGTDASGEQIARAPVHPRAQFHRGVAGESGLPRRSVDLATAAQAAHWFDLESYYREVQRVARPGALLALLTYGTPSVVATVDWVVERFYSGALGRYWPPERSHVEKGYRSLPFPFPELEAPNFEMEVEWTAPEFLGYVGTWSAVRALERAEGTGPTRTFAAELTEAWGGDAPRRVRWPLTVRVGRI